jgi:hypothetical protein
MLDVILGGITGLVGNAFTSWFKYKNAKMEYTHKEKMVDLETQAMIQEAQMQIDITKSRIEGEIELADAAAFDTSQKVGSQRLFHEKWIDMIMEAGRTEKWYSFVFKIFGTMISASFAFVDWLNAMMRPALTIYLLGTSSYITYLAWKIMQTHGLTITADQAVSIFEQVTSTMIYLTVSAVTWWLGDRSVSKFLQQREKKRLEEK